MRSRAAMELTRLLSTRWLTTAALAALVIGAPKIAAAQSTAAPPHVLRVCADPNNLP